MKAYCERFIEFLIHAGALTFGDFTTKSGRKTPYFINTGNFNNGSLLNQLGEFYAEHIVANKITDFASIFGPAYKGIPLAVATGVALARNHQLNVGVSFNRKEAKEHGDKGNIVGHQLKPGESIVIVEDVITAGTTLKEVVPYLRSDYKVNIKAVVIAVDRAERGTGQLSAVQELEQDLGLKIRPLITIHDIKKFLKATTLKTYELPNDLPERIDQYLEQYGA